MKTNKKILIITSSYPCESEPERGKFIEQQVQEMIKAGFSMIILTPHIPGVSFHQHQPHLEIYRFPYFFPFSLQRLCGSGGLFFGFRSSILGKIQVIPFMTMMILYAGFIFCRHSVSLIHSHWIFPQGIAGAIWGKILGIPHITTSHVLDVTIAQKYPLIIPLIRMIISGTDAVTVNSSFTQRMVRQYGSGDIQIHIIPMGVDTTRIAMNPLSNLKQRDGHAILFVGRIIEWKGVDVLIHAFSRIQSEYPDATLTIIGDGPFKRTCEEMIRNENLSSRITMKGRVTDDELNSGYATADLFILPSKEHGSLIMEGLGVVLLEAIAQGVPVVGSRVGGIPDIIEDNITGFLSDPGDEDSLAKIIRYVFQHPQTAHACALRARERISARFSWDYLGEQFVQVYREVLHDATRHNETKR